MTERQVQLIRDFKPNIIMCTPSYLLVIGDEFVRQGLDPSKCGLRVGIFGAEPWTEACARSRAAASACGARPVRSVGSHRTGVAQECIETRDGLTVWEDHFFPRDHRSENGAVLPRRRKRRARDSPRSPKSACR